MITQVQIEKLPFYELGLEQGLEKTIIKFLPILDNQTIAQQLSIAIEKVELLRQQQELKNSRQ